MKSYEDAPEVKALLKDAKYVRILKDVRNQPYGQAIFSIPVQEMWMLYSGPSGSYIVYLELYAGLVPEQRVLRLPDGLDLASKVCLAYESEHRKDYSPSYDMVEYNETQP